MDEAMAELAEAGFFPPGSPDVPLLAEMIVFGDGGCVLDKVRAWSFAHGRCVSRVELTPHSKLDSEGLTLISRPGCNVVCTA